MAKRKKPIEERRKLKAAKADSVLLKRYARFCYHKARAEKAQAEYLPIAAMVPKDGLRHDAMIKVAEKKLRSWFAGLGVMQGRARLRIQEELDLGYTPRSVPEE